MPAEQRLAVQQMVQGFVNTRMIVAVRLLINSRQYVSAYEVLVRLVANGSVPAETLAEYRSILAGRAALQALVQTFQSMTNMPTIGLFGVHEPLMLQTFIGELDASARIEVLDDVDLASIAQKDRYLVLSGEGVHREHLLGAGFPPGQVWAEGDLNRQFAI